MYKKTGLRGRAITKRRFRTNVATPAKTPDTKILFFLIAEVPSLDHFSTALRPAYYDRFANAALRIHAPVIASSRRCGRDSQDARQCSSNYILAHATRPLLHGVAVQIHGFASYFSTD